MILTDSEVASLKSALRCWEWFGYASTAIVGLGCIGEFIAEFTAASKDESLKHKLSRLSLIVLIFGIAGELLSAVRTSNLSGQLIANIEERTGNAQQKASANEVAAGQLRVDLENSKADTKAAETRLQTEQRNTAEAQKEAAQAQLALNQYITVVAKSVNPRVIDRKRFIELMKGQPKAVVEIWHEPNDGEAEILALQLGIALGKEGVGWDTEIMPFTAVRDPSMEIIRQDSGANGLAYAAKTITSDRDSPLQVLFNAVELSLGGWGKGTAMFVTDPTLPDNHFVIAVGHHVVNVPLWSPPKPKKQSNSTKPKN